MSDFRGIDRGVAPPIDYKLPKIEDCLDGIEVRLRSWRNFAPQSGFSWNAVIGPIPDRPRFLRLRRALWAAVKP